MKMTGLLRDTLRDGECYAGVILGKDVAIDHHLILLPGDAQNVTWTAARAWAGELGGELPNRRELALLLANQKEQFQREWYWSSEQSEARAQLVWGQNFTSGIQTMYGRAFQGRARTIRRVPVE